MTESLEHFAGKFAPKCEFEIEVKQLCEGTREFNYLDYLFYWDSETYEELCKWSDIPNPTPSQLMKVLDSKVGQQIKVMVDDLEFIGVFDLTENYEIVIKDCKRV